MNARLWILIACFVSGLGCGDSGTGPIPIESFERELAEAYCAAAERCDTRGNLVVAYGMAGGPGHCAEITARLLSGEGGFPVLRAAVASGEVSYDPVAARACIDSFKGLCPPCTEIDPQEWCPEAFEGVCFAATKSPWHAPVAVGGACGVDGLCCADGLSCAGDESRVCRPRLPEGNPCTAEDCAVGLVCSGDGSESTCQTPDEVDQADPDLAAGIAAFTTDRTSGVSCYKPGDYLRQGLCNAGLVCHLDTMTCGAPKKNGASCQSGGECAGVCRTDGTGVGQCEARDLAECASEPSGVRNPSAGGEDAGSSTSSAKCTPGTQSTPTMAGNPCPTNNPACSSAMGKMAVTTCGADGVWIASKPGGACDCLPIGCGDGVMDPGEACDPKLALPATATCMAMGKGTGTITCNPLTCTFNVAQCVPAAP